MSREQPYLDDSVEVVATGARGVVTLRNFDDVRVRLEDRARGQEDSWFHRDELRITHKACGDLSAPCMALAPDRKTRCNRGLNHKGDHKEIAVGCPFWDRGYNGRLRKQKLEVTVAAWPQSAPSGQRPNGDQAKLPRFAIGYGCARRAMQ